MLTQILIDPNLETRKQAIYLKLESQGFLNNHPDLFILEDVEKLGIDQVKKIINFLSIKPYSASRRAIGIVSAHNLSLDAQNALLKTLEEPPGDPIILLGVKSDANLLPTIISRCQIITLNEYQKNKSIYEKSIERLNSLSIEQRFQFIEKLDNKDQFLTALVNYFHQNLEKEASNVDFINSLLEAEEWKESNVNIRAILEYLMLKLG